MTLYSIQDTTLTGIADGLRKWYGETKTITVSGMRPVPLKVVSKTPNATGFDTRNGGHGNNQRLYDVVTIPGASIIKVKMAYQTENTVYDYVQVAAGNLTTMPSDATKYGNILLTTTELIFRGTDTITFYFHSDTSNDVYLGYYAECYGLDENGDLILSDEEEMQTWEEEVLNTFKPEEMGAAIGNYQYFSDEELTFSGDCSYLFAYDKWKSVLEKEQSRLRMSDVTGLAYLFSNSTYEDLSWLTINCDDSGIGARASYMFEKCRNLKKLPTFNNLKFYTNQSGNLFYECNNLTDTDGLVRFFSNSTFGPSSPQGSYWFYNCYSLRNIDAVMPCIKAAWEAYASNYYVNYTSMFQGCSSLDEINNIYINTHAASTSNRFSSMVHSCYRLKNLTFETNEDGTPLVWQAKGQTLDLSELGYYNYSNNKNNILNYSSGITEDKEVVLVDDYHALKNDPDWFAGHMKCSRYNHDSAVNTINSLPDTSAYLAANGGTNTIKFRGEAGSLTDGGAINTLTEEEIAVATAKGWTVTLV
jgi:hypothetical protein